MIDLKDRGWIMVFEAAIRIASRRLEEGKWVSVQPYNRFPAIYVGDPTDPRRGVILRPSASFEHHIDVLALPPDKSLNSKELPKGTFYFTEVT